MNWLDFVLLGTLAICAAVGLKLGLIKAVLAAAAVYVGGVAAGRLSGVRRRIPERPRVAGRRYR